MATWRARWFDPLDRKPKSRVFTSKGKAEAFRDLPRDYLVFVTPEPRRYAERLKYVRPTA